MHNERGIAATVLLCAIVVLYWSLLLRASALDNEQYNAEWQAELPDDADALRCYLPGSAAGASPSVAAQLLNGVRYLENPSAAALRTVEDYLRVHPSEFVLYSRTGEVVRRMGPVRVGEARGQALQIPAALARRVDGGGFNERSRGVLAAHTAPAPGVSVSAAPHYAHWTFVNCVIAANDVGRNKC